MPQMWRQVATNQSGDKSPHSKIGGRRVCERPPLEKALPRRAVLEKIKCVRDPRVLTFIRPRRGIWSAATWRRFGTWRLVATPAALPPLAVPNHRIPNWSCRGVISRSDRTKQMSKLTCDRYAASSRGEGLLTEGKSQPERVYINIALLRRAPKTVSSR